MKSHYHITAGWLLLWIIQAAGHEPPEATEHTAATLGNRSVEIAARLDGLEFGSDVPRALLEIRDEIFSFPEVDQQSAATHVARRLKTILWFKLLDRFDALRVPDGASTGPPGMHAPAPPGYVPGSDPSVIADAAVRKQYEEAIRKHSAAAARYNLQYQLKTLDERFSAQAIAYCRRQYKKTNEDVAELRSCLDSSLKSEVRRSAIEEHLKALLDGE